MVAAAEAAVVVEVVVLVVLVVETIVIVVETIVYNIPVVPGQAGGRKFPKGKDLYSTERICL